MTNSNKVAILGSCGGYQNISKAMENAFDVQIISTKQVGTLAVNTVLIQEITETIRSGKDLVWANIWQQVSLKLKDNIQFKDYIPPYKNLGARFIKAYDAM
jgi:cobyric acid synthase